MTERDVYTRLLQLHSAHLLLLKLDTQCRAVGIEPPRVMASMVSEARAANRALGVAVGTEQARRRFIAGNR